jgi:hypothetical protein
MRFIQIIFLALLSGCTHQALVFKGGHSHNDYHQQAPLHHAMKEGMVSIEADIFARNGKLLVGHTEAELNSSQTIESLYLNPLAKAISNSNQHFNPIILLVDIKDNGIETYALLKNDLAQYREILTEYSNNKTTNKPVTIVLSGDRPIEILKNEQQRFAFLDGRFNAEDLSSDPKLMPLISDDWNNYFKWDGNGTMPDEEYKRLVRMVNECHSQNKMIRFWGIPNNPETNEAVWNVLESAQVDLIGTDCPSCLKQFYNKKK